MESGQCYIFKKNQDIFSFLRYACECISDDETRYFMQYLYVDENSIAATDGRRMIVIEKKEGSYLHEIQQGFYSVILKTQYKIAIMKKDVDAVFPNCKKLIDQYEQAKKEKNEIDLYFQRIKKKNILFEIGKILDKKDRINTNFFKYFPHDVKYDVYLIKGKQDYLDQDENKNVCLNFVYKEKYFKVLIYIMLMYQE